MKKSSIYQGVRCFASVDLTGSTQLKNDLPISGNSFGDNWLTALAEFFEMSAAEFLSHQSSYEFEELPKVKMNFWRCEGDEVLFYSDRLHDEKQVSVIFYRLFNAVQKLDDHFKKRYKLGVKGAIWAAGFPRRNVEFMTSNEPPFVRLVPSPFHNIENYYNRIPFLAEDGRLDFLGLEIDLGFRLKEHTSSGRIVGSLDVVRFLAQNSGTVRTIPVRLHLVGWARLKGVYSGRPYPIFWIDLRSTESRARKRSVLEAIESSYAKEFLHNPKSELPNQQIFELYDDYISVTDGEMIKMYIRAEDMDSRHAADWETVVNGEKTNDI